MTYARDPYDTDQPPCVCGHEDGSALTTEEFCPAHGDPAKPAPEPTDLDYDDADYEPCTHDCDENCEAQCDHQHCFGCGGCQCPGYCDDYQTYNLRPGETGADPTPEEG
jgi:hypothetical protein